MAVRLRDRLGFCLILALKACILFVAIQLIGAEVSRAQHWLGAPSITGWTKLTDQTLPNLDTLYGDARGRSGVALDFERLLSLYRWAGSVTAAGGYRATGLSPQFLTRLEARSRIQEESARRTSEGSLFILGSQPVMDDRSMQLQATLYGTSYAGSGQETAIPGISAITQAVDGFATFGGRYAVPSVQIELGGGLARQTQLGNSTNGAIYKGQAQLLPLEVSEDQLLDGSVAFDERSYLMRGLRLEQNRARLALRSALGGNDRNYASISASLLRRDFLFPIDSAQPIKQMRREMQFSFSDQLDFALIPEKLLSSFSLDVEPRLVTRESDAGEFLLTNRNLISLSSSLLPTEVSGLRLAGEARIQSYGGAGLELPQLSSTAFGLTVRHEERNESVSLERQKLPSMDRSATDRFARTLGEASFSSALTQASGFFAWQASNDGRLMLEGVARILRYDTPDTLVNHDDRDDLFATITARYEHSLSKAFTTAVDLRLSRSHLVYLSRERSAQNAVTRTIALASRSTYRSPSAINMLSGTVFANYVLYDYLELLTALQSNGNYLLRGLDLHDSLRLQLGHGIIHSGDELWMEANGDFRVSERGGFDADAFSERRSTENVEFAGEMLLTTILPDRIAPLKLQAGLRGFWLTRSRQDELRQAWGEIERQYRIGPLVTVVLEQQSSVGPRLYGALWYAYVTSFDRTNAITSHSRQLEAHLGTEWRF